MRGGEDFEEAVVAAVSRSRCLRLGGRRGESRARPCEAQAGRPDRAWGGWRGSS